MGNFPLRILSVTIVVDEILSGAHVPNVNLHLNQIRLSNKVRIPTWAWLIDWRIYFPMLAIHNYLLECYYQCSCRQDQQIFHSIVIVVEDLREESNVHSIDIYLRLFRLPIYSIHNWSFSIRMKRILNLDYSHSSLLTTWIQTTMLINSQHWRVSSERLFRAN